MLRLVVILLILLAILLLLGGLYLAYRKIRRGIGDAWDKSVEVANEQQQRWKLREQIKSQPDYIQTGYQQSEQIEHDTQLLPFEWQDKLAPINERMQQVLTISMSDHERAGKVRAFYNTSLPAYATFVGKLKTDHGHLDEHETSKAVANITVFEQDFARYSEQIQQARRFDFDVLMDVIKVRLKNR